MMTTEATSGHISDPTITVIVPALDEAEGLSLILGRIPEIVTEIIVVDGGSSDGTLEVTRAHRPDAVLLKQTGRGKGNAIKAGLAAASGDIIVILDADGSMNPEDVPRFVQKLLAGHDFVKGSRVLPGGSSEDFTVLRRWGNWVLTQLVNAIFGCAYSDLTFGFCAFWRQIIVNVSCLGDGFELEVQAAIRAAKTGLRVTEVPCHEPQRVGGRSKLNPLTDGLFILRVIIAEALPRSRSGFRRIADLYTTAAAENPTA